MALEFLCEFLRAYGKFQSFEFAQNMYEVSKKYDTFYNIQCAKSFSIKVLLFQLYSQKYEFVQKPALIKFPP